MLRLLKRGAVLAAAILITLMAVRIYDTQRGPPLELWHVYAPTELSADEIDQADWSRYLTAEQAIFDDLRAEVTAELDAEDRISVNRYFEDSPVHPGRFAQDWSRSFVLEPEGALPARWCSCTGSPTAPIASVTSRAATSRTALSREEERRASAAAHGRDLRPS